MTEREWFKLPERAAAGGGLLYDAVELAPVAVIDADGNCEAFTSLSEMPTNFRASAFWSLYGHIPGQGAECIGDFKSREHAIQVLYRMFGKLEILP